MERGNVAGVIGFGHDWATLLARGPRAPLTALRFASASRRKLATPLATQSCGFEHSSRLPTAAAIAQPERSPNDALITLRESPRMARGLMTHTQAIERTRKRKESNL